MHYHLDAFKTLFFFILLDLTVSPIKAPKRAGIPSQISTAGSGVANWAPLSRLKNSFSNSAMGVNTPVSSGNGIGGVSGLKSKLGTSLISSSKQDVSGNSSENSTTVSSAQNELNRSDPTSDRALHAQSANSGTVLNAPKGHNDTILSNELDGGISESVSKPETAIDNEDDDDPNSAMVFERGRPLEEELWFHGVLPRGIKILLFHRKNIYFRSNELTLLAIFRSC